VLFTKKSPIFQVNNKSKFQVIVNEISNFETNGYQIAGVGYTDDENYIESGYSLSISGKTDQYYVNETPHTIKNLTISLDIDCSNARFEFERGIFGGGLFESNTHISIQLSLESINVKDIIQELRLNSNQGFRIDGYLINEKLFRVAFFQLFEKQ